MTKVLAQSESIYVDQTRMTKLLYIRVTMTEGLFGLNTAEKKINIPILQKARRIGGWKMKIPVEYQNPSLHFDFSSKQKLRQTTTHFRSETFILFLFKISLQGVSEMVEQKIERRKEYFFHPFSDFFCLCL